MNNPIHVLFVTGRHLGLAGTWNEMSRLCVFLPVFNKLTRKFDLKLCICKCGYCLYPIFFEFRKLFESAFPVGCEQAEDQLISNQFPSLLYRVFNYMISYAIMAVLLLILVSFLLLDRVLKYPISL